MPLIYPVSSIKSEYKILATCVCTIDSNIILFSSILFVSVLYSTIVLLLLDILNLNVSIISICFPSVIVLKLISLFILSDIIFLFMSMKNSEKRISNLVFFKAC